MDLTTCSPLYATDLILTPVPTGLCSALILPWIFFMMILAVGNIWVAVKRRELHLRRKGHRVVPWMVILSWLSAASVILLTFVPFVGTNASNGGSLALIEIVFFTFGAKSLLLMRKLVRLGRKIIPLSQKFIMSEESTASSTASGSAMLLGSLSSVDTVLAVAFSFGWILLFVQGLFMTLLVYVVPAKIEIWVTVALALEEVFIAVACFSIVYQFHRCILAMQTTADLTTAIRSTQRSKLGATIRKMRTQQAILLTISIPAQAFYILCAVMLIPRHFGAAIVIVGLDVLSNVLILISFTTKYKSSEQVASTVEAGSPGMALQQLTSTSDPANPPPAA